MASNNKRRETTRRQLEQQLQERQRREAARKRAVLIGSIAGTVVVIALVVVLVVVLGSGSGSDKKTQAGGQNAPTTSSPPSTSSPSTSSPSTASKPCTVTHPKGSVVFDGVTVANPTNLAKNPDTTSCSKITPTKLEVKDLVKGKGAAASPTSTVSVQYAGVLYRDGTAFDSSWARGGTPTSFSLKQVVKGFTYGIGGMGKIAPMKVGGRRIIILPSSLGYGAQASGAIPANSPLVFVVDLKSVK